MAQGNKIDARELLGLKTATAGPVFIHDAGVAATLMDGTVFDAAVKLYVASEDITFAEAARKALDALDEFRVAVQEWSAEKEAEKAAAVNIEKVETA